MKFLIFPGLLVLGFVFIYYSKWIVDNTMRFPSVEKFLGSGGTYTFWKIAGVVTIAAAFYYVFNL